MDIKVKIKVPSDMILSGNEAAQAAEFAVRTVVARNFEDHDATAKHRQGFRKSDYWMDASDATVSRVQGNKILVDCDKEGVAMHYAGGVVLPKRKALAIPADPSVGDMWPSEYAGEVSLIWNKGESRGALKDPDTGEVLWWLVPKATIPADKSVLPSDDMILTAAIEAIVAEQEARVA